LNIKTYIQSKLHKTNIPDTKDAIMMRMKHIDLEVKQSKKVLIHPFFFLKIVSSFMIILGLSLLALPLFDTKVEAFTSYDEVMILSSTSVYALYESHMSPIEDDMSFAHVITLRSQLRTMIRYAYTFERLIQTEDNFNIEKNQTNNRYELQFEAVDALKSSLPFQIDVEKSFKSNKRDQFEFNGQFQSFDVLGDVSYEKDRHIVRVTYVKDSFQVKVTYDNETRTYEVEMIVDNTIMSSFSFFITYDLFDRPTLHMTYDEDGIKTDLVIHRSVISQEMTIEYVMQNDDTIFKGLITIQVLGGIIPRYMIEINFEEGDTLRFQFIRPKTIRDNRMPMTNNVIFKNVL
jgi:hypothetical protein